MTRDSKLEVGDLVILNNGDTGKIDYIYTNLQRDKKYVINYYSNISPHSDIYEEEDLNLLAEYKFKIGDTVCTKRGDKGTIAFKLILPSGDICYIVKKDGYEVLLPEKLLEKVPTESRPEKFWLIAEIPAAEEYQPHKYASFEEAKKAFEKLGVYHRRESYVIMESVYE